jgi:outer membrane protein OmpU
MKKVLLTSTALTMLAGAAAADVAISGSARMGVSSVRGVAANTNRMRVNFTGSGTTDSGLTFGAWTRIQSNSAALGTIAGSRVYMSNGTMTLTVGNVGSASRSVGGLFSHTAGFNSAVSVYGVTGLLAVGGGSTSGAVPANRTRLDLSLGSANISVAQGGAGGMDVAIGASLGGWNVAFSYDQDKDYVITAGGAVGGMNAYIQYGNEVAGNGVSYGLGLSGAVGSGTVTAVYGRDANAANTAGGLGRNGAGIGYAQSLGGGATASVTYSNAGAPTVSAGVNMSF